MNRKIVTVICIITNCEMALYLFHVIFKVITDRVRLSKYMEGIRVREKISYQKDKPVFGINQSLFQVKYSLIFHLLNVVLQKGQHREQT